MSGPVTFSLSQEQYEALIALARRGTQLPDGTFDQAKVTQLEAFLRSIEKANGIQRFALWIRWQNPTAPLPPRTNFPKTWPPNLSFYLEFLSRPITQQDVLDIVNQRTPNATNIMVTPDPAALLGWTQLSAYFTQP